jgi:FkbM family methyltransferase
MRELIKNALKPIYKFLTNRNVREFYKLLSRQQNVPRYKAVSNVKFLNYKFDVPDLRSFVWQFKDIFVDQIYKLKFENNSPLIFDCGANIGTSCLYFKKEYPESKIIAFEGDVKIAEILLSNLRKNNIFDVEVVNKLVWTDDLGINFKSDGADGGAIDKTKSSNLTKSIRLKTYLDSESSIDLLKIDIEGAECEVLKDCRGSLNYVKNIFIEYHSLKNQNQNLSIILNILEDNGFRYYIEDLHKRKTPFIDKGINLNMDLQLNIFAYK